MFVQKKNIKEKNGRERKKQKESWEQTYTDHNLIKPTANTGIVPTQKMLQNMSLRRRKLNEHVTDAEQKFILKFLSGGVQDFVVRFLQRFWLQLEQMLPQLQLVEPVVHQYSAKGPHGGGHADHLEW